MFDDTPISDGILPVITFSYNVNEAEEAIKA
jgi:hypothetical protein